MAKFVFYNDLNNSRLRIPKRYHVVYWNAKDVSTGAGLGFGHSGALMKAAYAADGGARNKALDKLYEKIGQAEDLRVAWKERQQSIDMVTSGVRTIVNIARAVRRRDPKIIRAILRRNPRKRDIATTPSGLWLQYWFGIVPTISDIHHAAGIFAEPLPETDLRVRSSAKWTEEVTGYPQLSLPGTSAWASNSAFTSKVVMGGRISAISPHVALASRLGFGQPLSVAWEMTPFSWFVDYFVNVGQLINNLEPRFPGFTIVDQYFSTRTTVVTSGYLRNHNGWGWYPDEGHYHGTAIGFRREVSLPPYRLEFSSPLDLSLKRCSYIVAVAVQLLSSFKR